MRLSLCVILFLSAGWIGLHRSEEYKKRPLRLQYLADSLAVLQVEICNRKTPLPEALLHCSNAFKELNSFYQRLFVGTKTDQSFSEVWACAVDRLYPEQGEEQYSLLTLGEQMGRYDAQTQEAAFRTCTNVLRNCALRIGANSKVSAKLAAEVGAVSGLLLAIACY